MKQKEIKSLSIDGLNEKLAVEQEAFQKLQFAHAISPIENPMKIRHTRKLIARLQTELTAKKAKV
jgi:large subunit ribosomal protein L29